MYIYLNPNFLRIIMHHTPAPANRPIIPHCLSEITLYYKVLEHHQQQPNNQTTKNQQQQQ